MPWSDDNGRDQGPWGRNRGNSNGSQGGGSSNGYQPELEEIIRRGQDKFKSWSPKFRGARGIILIVIIAIGIWLATDFYRVKPD